MVRHGTADNTQRAGISIDGVNLGADYTVTNAPGVSRYVCMSDRQFIAGLSEGSHYATIFGSTNGGTMTFGAQSFLRGAVRRG